METLKMILQLALLWLVLFGFITLIIFSWIAYIKWKRKDMDKKEWYRKL